MEWLWSAPAATRFHAAQEQRRIETVAHTADDSLLLLLLAVGERGKNVSFRALRGIIDALGALVTLFVQPVRRLVQGGDLLQIDGAKGAA